MERPSRKPNRLPNYNYKDDGIYFVTICVQNRKEIFWGKSDNEKYKNSHYARLPDGQSLTTVGRIIDETIQTIQVHYPEWLVDHYTIMPDHIHLLLRASNGTGLSRMINQLKGTISKRIGESIWQKSFHDHVVRDESDYLRIWTYIDNNPLNRSLKSTIEL